MPGAIDFGSLDKSDAEDVCWCVIESIASANDTASSMISVIHFLREAYGVEDVDEQVIPNPAFLANGHEGRSPRTRKYMGGRMWTGLGGSAVSLVGGAASSVTMVDVGGILKEGSAVGTTVAHMMGVHAAGKGFKRSETVTRWVNAMLKAKSAKLGVRGAGLAGASIPIPAVGLATSIGTTVAKLGIKVTLGKLIARTSMEVHWRAYQETVISGAIGGRGGKDGPVGPASAMFYEIFTKRSFTRIFGKYDTAMLIREPGGWMALNDKLMLM
ncbi:hypothetical protein [Mesorhizobium sp. CAU 1741]|uniref:hypothetical protein n=1 Tax=Mesorhizobium sp. CAU 1741 TaxID=3140366 RepID=UPI00325B1DE7